MIIKRDGNNTRKQARISHCIEIFQTKGIEKNSFDVIKTVDYIDSYHV